MNVYHPNHRVEICSIRSNFGMHGRFGRFLQKGDVEVIDFVESGESFDAGDVIFEAKGDPV